MFVLVLTLLYDAFDDNSIVTNDAINQLAVELLRVFLVHVEEVGHPLKEASVHHVGNARQISILMRGKVHSNGHTMVFVKYC